MRILTKTGMAAGLGIVSGMIAGATSVSVSAWASGAVQASPQRDLSAESSAEPDDAGADRIFGDLGGLRGRWAERGFEAVLAYRGDTVSGFSGGSRRRTAYLGMAELKLDFDFEKMAGATGLRAYVDVTGIHGGLPPSSFVGDAQATSNIEAPPAFRFYEVWLQQTLGPASIKAGLYDLNTEFYVTPSSALFLNSSFGVGRELSQTGMNGPSIYPYTGLAIRAELGLGPQWSVRGAVFDGVPGDPERTGGTYIRLNSEEGALLTGEVTWKPTERDLLTLGGYGYTSRQDRLDGADKSTSRGIYVLADHRLTQDWSVFFRQGWANPAVSQFSANTAGGVNFRDAFGLGFTTVWTGSDALRVAQGEGMEAKSSETAIEATYRANLGRGVQLQPDLQYVINPGVDPALANAWVGTLRVYLTF